MKEDDNGGILGFALVIGIAAFVGAASCKAGKDTYNWAKNKVQSKIKELKSKNLSQND